LGGGACETLKAIRFDKQLLYVENQPQPVAGDGECLVRVHLAGICATDHHITRGDINFAGVLGHEMVGTVVDGSAEWSGKRVAAEINCVCGGCDMCLAGLSAHCRSRTVLGIAGRDGCFAEYVVVPERNLHAIPDVISDEEAVFVEPLAAACAVIKQVRIEPRMQVSVVGSGRLGLLVVQVLARTGCKLDVYGRNPLTLAFCEKRGVQATPVAEMTGRNDRDVVVECTGCPEGLEAALRLVRPRGTVVIKSTYARDACVDLSRVVVNEVTVVGSRCGPFADAIAVLARREIDVGLMIARTYGIDRGVEAFAASEDPKHIKVLLRLGPR